MHMTTQCMHYQHTSSSSGEGVGEAEGVCGAAATGGGGSRGTLLVSPGVTIRLDPIPPAVEP